MIEPTVPSADMLVPLLISFRERWPSGDEVLGLDRVRPVVETWAELKTYNRERDAILAELLALMIEVITSPDDHDWREEIGAMGGAIETGADRIMRVILEHRSGRVS